VATDQVRPRAAISVLKQAIVSAALPSHFRQTTDRKASVLPLAHEPSDLTGMRAHRHLSR
jgi:hypothetical protein